MKAWLIFGSSNKILFWSADEDARKQIKCFNNTSEVDQLDCHDRIVQTFLPFLVSFNVCLEDHNTYDLVFLENGTVIACQQFEMCKNVIYMVINKVTDNYEETEYITKRELELIYLISLSVHSIVLQSSLQLDKRWTLVDEIMRTGSRSLTEDQSVLFQSIERVQVNDMLSSKCISLLENVVFSFKTAGIKNASHCFFVMNDKLLALWSSPSVSQIASEDIQILLLTAKSIRIRKANAATSEKTWLQLVFLKRGLLAHRLHIFELFPTLYLLVLVADDHRDLGLSLVQLARFCDSDEPVSTKASKEAFEKLLKSVLEHLKRTKMNNNKTVYKNVKDIFRTSSKQLVLNVVNNLFQTIFPSSDSEEITLSPTLTNMLSHVMKELVDYEPFFAVKSSVDVSISRYAHFRAEGLLHFVFVNRENDQIVSPSLSEDVDERRNIHNVLKRVIWTKLPGMREKLAAGYHNVMMRLENFYVSYFLCFENEMGMCAELAHRKSHSTLPIGGHDSFWQWLFNNTQSTVSNYHAYELLCIHAPDTQPGLICSHARNLAKQLWEHTNPCNSPIGVI